MRKMNDQYNVEVEGMDDLGRGFKIAPLIDCMTVASDRTGGGPTTPGKFAERFPLLEGYSCRRHDIHLLGGTDMNSKLERSY